MAEEKTLKQLGEPRLDDDPFAIVLPTLDKPQKLNSRFVSLLPKFYGNTATTSPKTSTDGTHLLLAPVNYVCLHSVKPSLRPLSMAMSTVSIHVFGDVPSSPLVGVLQIGPLRCWPGGLCLSRSLGDRDVGEFITPVPYVKQVRAEFKYL